MTSLDLELIPKTCEAAGKLPLAHDEEILDENKFIIEDLISWTTLEMESIDVSRSVVLINNSYEKLIRSV